MSQPIREKSRRVLATLVILGLVMLSMTWMLRVELQWLWNEWQNRTPQELIRYTMRRLEGHTKLETVLLPPLRRLQQHYEREPGLLSVPTLGKGQQTESPPNDLPTGMREWRVDTPQDIRQALNKAAPGTRIVIQPGLYPFDRNLYLGRDGTAEAPIVLTAEQPGTVWFEFTQLDGIFVNRPHWMFENLNIRGTCANDHYCEHAFHVVGRGAHTRIHNNLLVDFNAHIKVNGFKGDWPDHGKATWNTLINRRPRETVRSVTPFDLVGANQWLFAHNVVANFVKKGRDRVSYGVFMKGASEGGLIEENVVICTPTNISQPGIRVGISFGGGGSGAAYCREGGCSAYEHAKGTARRNVIAHCNDSGIDLNRSQDILLSDNLLINTSGMTLRQGSKAIVDNNRFEGTLALRDNSTIHARKNQHPSTKQLPLNLEDLAAQFTQK